jgi:hypothetical protein
LNVTFKCSLHPLGEDEGVRRVGRIHQNTHQGQNIAMIQISMSHNLAAKLLQVEHNDNEKNIRELDQHQTVTTYNWLSVHVAQFLDGNSGAISITAKDVGICVLNNWVVTVEDDVVDFQSLGDHTRAGADVPQKQTHAVGQGMEVSNARKKLS